MPEAGAHVKNKQSQKTLEKACFRREGVTSVNGMVTARNVWHHIDISRSIFQIACRLFSKIE